ncbi:hypothetical protein ACLB2K_010383 [Fragaria x ananassa]
MNSTLFRWKKVGDLLEHLRKFQNCVVDLSMMGAKYEDDDKALLLMRSLPPSFKHFKSKIMSGGSTLLFDEVIDALQSYVKMNENSGCAQVQGLSAKVRSHSKGKQTKGCFVCGASDHRKRNCEIWKENFCLL